MPKALMFTAPGQIQYEYYQEEVVGDDEVKVQSILSGISHGTEMNIYRGTAPGFHKYWDKAAKIFIREGTRKVFPVAPGYECVGKIVELGSKVEDLRIGDLVWLDRPHRELNIVSREEATKGLLPKNMTPEKAVFCALTRVALDAIHCAQIKVGDKVAVVGIGTIGLISVQLAKLNGATEVYAIDNHPLRLAMSTRLGAIAISNKEKNAAYQIKKMTNLRGVDAVLEVSGAYPGLQTAISMCAMGGIVVTGSSYQGEARGLFLGEEYHRNRITLISSMSVNGCPHRNYPLWDFGRLNETARSLLSNSLIQVEQMITHFIPFDEAKIAYSLIDQSPDKTIKVVLFYENYKPNESH